MMRLQKSRTPIAKTKVFVPGRIKGPDQGALIPIRIRMYMYGLPIPDPHDTSAAASRAPFAGIYMCQRVMAVINHILSYLSVE